MTHAKAYFNTHRLRIRTYAEVVMLRIQENYEYLRATFDPRGLRGHGSGDEATVHVHGLIEPVPQQERKPRGIHRYD